MSDVLSVIIADDHELYRKGIVSALRDEPGIARILEASGSAECLELVKNSDADILLMDDSLPGTDSVDLARHALRLHPRLRILLMAISDDAFTIQKYVQSGIHGIIMKNTNISGLLSAIRCVLDDEWYNPPSLDDAISRARDERKMPHRVTERERQIITMVAAGLTNKEIADKLFVSKRTICNHRANLHKKTDSHNSIQLLSWAIRNKIIEKFNT